LTELYDGAGNRIGYVYCDATGGMSFANERSGSLKFLSNGVDRLTVYSGGGAYLGNAPSDPGAFNFKVQGTVEAGDGFIYTPTTLANWTSGADPGMVKDALDQLASRTKTLETTGGGSGTNGWSPVFAVVSDGERRVLQVADWQGGTGTKPTTGLYVGTTGLVALIANGVDVRGATGAAGATGAPGATGATGAAGPNTVTTSTTTNITGLLKGNGTTVAQATAGTDFVATNDSRLTDARTPTSHVHGGISNEGAIGTTSGLPIKTGTSGVLEVGAFGSSAGQFAQGNDSRFHDRSHAITSTSDHTAGNWKVFHSNGSGQLVELALGADGTFLKSNGASLAPSFATPAGGGEYAINTSSFTDSSGTLVAVPNMSFSIAGGETVTAIFSGFWQTGTSNYGFSYDFTGPASPTFVTYGESAFTALAAIRCTGNASSFNTLKVQASGTIGTVFPITIQINVTASSGNGGTVALRMAAEESPGAFTLLRGFTMHVMRV